MGDVTIKFVPPRLPLPIDDDATPAYGELNYITYPGLSVCQEIELENTTGGALTVDLAFKEHEIDPIWWRTLRLYDTCSGVVPSGNEWDVYTVAVAANSTESLQLWSDVTKEGWSRQWHDTSWTDNGFGIADLALINDYDEETAAVDLDGGAIGATLTLDVGADNTEEFRRLKVSATADFDLTATFDIQYSDDDITYTTVYEDMDLSLLTVRQQMHAWWNSVGAHRYWRIEKTNAVNQPVGTVTEIQFLLFDAHEAHEFNVYGDKRCYMYDNNENMDDFEIRSSVMVNIDVYARQNYQKPIGRIGTKSLKAIKNINKWGQTAQLYYIPTATMSANLNIYSDFQLERRVWDTRVIISPGRRDLQYTAAADGLAPSLYRYDQRTVYFSPLGPDFVGWYQTNYDFFHAYGHSYYLHYDNHCYKLDDVQPVYIDNEVVSFSSRMFLQSDMTNLATDPRNYILTNRDGLFEEFPTGGYSVSTPSNWIDTTTPEQRPMRWNGAYPTYVFDRTRSLRPNPYALAATQAADLTFNGEAYETEEWIDPAGTNYETERPVMFGVRANLGTGNAAYYQMDRYFNWLGYVDGNGTYETFPTVVQLYLDEDCTVPIKINREYASYVSKVEYIYDPTLIAATGEVTLTALGTNFYTDGHKNLTPSKIYVKYIAEDAHITYYYPT